MELKQLETFYWIAQLGSFAGAADKLHTTQPSVSMRIRQLERDLGVKLFDTTRRTALLTSKGRELVEHAEHLLSTVSDLRQQMEKPETLSGRARVGVTETIALTWLPEFVRTMNETYPRVGLELDIDLTMNLWAKLKSGALDVVLLPGPVLEPSQGSVSLGKISYAWMGSTGLDLPKRTLEPMDLEAYPVISLAPESTLYGSIERWFRNNGATPKRIDMCNSLSVIAALTVSGLGVSLMPPTIYDEAVTRGDLCTLAIEPPLPPLEFFAVYPEPSVSPLPALIVDVANATSTFDRA